MSKGMIHHIELYVSELSRSVAFWDALLTELGYSRFQTWEYGQSWKIENSYLVIVQVEEKYLDIPYHRCRVGLNHLAFHAQSREQVDVITEKLRENHVTILYEDKHPFAGGTGHYAVYFEDPDRMKVEIVAPAT
ncbi:VOC family protein [Cytobacillus kochii]|uniref:VOC family protein n=1 Tax=Cytobacillus kochii TaxID=859143 RepID=UPI0025A1680E|nr:VOC family protein [Cytobacillus kochii]MDM5207720.1 VOC family protein [Cytobacillus kochii]